MQLNTATYEAIEQTGMSWCCFKFGILPFDTVRKKAKFRNQYNQIPQVTSLFGNFEATLDTSTSSVSTRNGF